MENLFVTMDTMEELLLGITENTFFLLSCYLDVKNKLAYGPCPTTTQNNKFTNKNIHLTAEITKNIQIWKITKL